MNNQIKKSYKIVQINGLKVYYYARKRKHNGPKVSVIFLAGYNSDMQGNKATYLENLSKKIGFEYLKFDYSGHGLSEGVIKDQLLSSWIEEAKYFIKHKLNYPTIIVGSSLGGWIGLSISKKTNKNIKGVIGIGAAPDFTKNIIKDLSRKEKKEYKKNKYISLGSDYSEENFIFTNKFIEDTKKFFILDKKINTNSIISLLYGSRDDAVSLSTQLKILEKLDAKNAKLTIVKNSDHRMSSVKDLELLEIHLNTMIKDIL